MWFEKLTGFTEKSPENVRQNIIVEGQDLVLLSNGQKLRFGKLEIPTLEQLRANSLDEYNNTIQVEEIVADVAKLHCASENRNALFQVASQFNLLEMINPNITPEQGIDRYEYDFTQGPICAIACGAGTIYRNYFAEVSGEIGQSKDNQIDCLDLISKEFNNAQLNLWEMKNGYALVSQNGLQEIDQKIAQLNEKEREILKGKLKIGLQWDSEVTISDTKYCVSQAYCSALPVAYTNIAPNYWQSFARIVLEASYEATFYAAVLNFERNKSNLLYLTLIGGGAFGNESEWILDAIKKAIRKFNKVPLNIKIVSYGQSNPKIQELIKELKN